MSTKLICPNTNLPEWKQLVAEKGIDAAYTQWITGQTVQTNEYYSSVKNQLQKLLPSTIGLETIEKLASEPKALGGFMSKTIYLLENAPYGTEYHEAFHAVYQTLLTDTELTEYQNLAFEQIKQEAKQANTSVAELIRAKQAIGYFTDKSIQEALPLFIEEWMADRFADYMISPQKGWLGQLFDRIVFMLKQLFARQKDINYLFSKIKYGQYKNASFATNQFNQEDYASQPVYKLLEKAVRYDTAGEPIIPYFGAEETAQIVRDTAAYYFEFKNSTIANVNKWSDDQIIDKILHLKKNQFKAYSSKEYLGTNEHDYWNLFTEEDMITSEGELVVGSRTKLKKEVIAYLKNFKRLQELSAESDESLVDEYGDKTILNAEMVQQGGWGTLPEFVRQYIAQVTYTDSNTIIGYRDELEPSLGLPTQVPVYQQKTVNPTKVYNGLLRALANTLSEEEMIEKLYNYGQVVEYIDTEGNVVKNGGNLDTYYFVQKFLRDTQLDTEKLLNRDTLSKKEREAGFIPSDNVNANLIYQKILKGFNRWAKNTIFNEIDTATNESKMYLANTKNVARLQFEQWHNTFKNSTSNRKKIAEELKSIIPLFQENSAYYTDQVAGTDFLESKSREQLIAEAIGKVNQVLLGVGISLSPNFIKYSLLYPKYLRLQSEHSNEELVLGRQTLTADEVNFLKSTIIDRNKRLKYEDFQELSKILADNRSPYEKSEDSQEGEDDAAIGRILNIAKGNALLDETVFESSYMAADGTIRYLHQDGTYHLKAIGKLRDPAFIAQLREKGIRDEAIVVGTKDDISINIDDEDKEFVRENRLLKENSDFLKIHKSLRIEELDGLKSVETIFDKTGADLGKTEREGVHFGDMSDRDFAVTLLNMYGNSKNFEVDSTGQKITVVPQLVSVMETSKSADFVYMPVIKGLYTTEGPTDYLLELVKDEVVKEYNRIHKVYTDITDNGRYLSYDELNEKLGFVIDVYHTGAAESRGLKISDKFGSFFTNEFKTLLETQAKTPEFTQWFSDNSELIKQELSKGIENLIEKTLDLLVDTEIIRTNGEKITNNFLSNVYFKGDDKLGFTTDFKSNIGQATMQQYLNTVSLSQLLHGDNALMYKNDGADPYKREKPNNAKIVSFKHSRTIPKLGVTPFQYSRIGIIEEPKSVSKLTGKKIDLADAQMWASVQAIRNSLFGLGRLTPEIAAILDKMDKGEEITTSDLFDRNGEIIDKDRFFNSFKFVFKDSKRTVKMSVVVLTKSLTSDYVNGRWQAKPGREQLHEMREQMDSVTNGVDFIGPKSAFKTYRSNILKSSNKATNTYDFSQLRPQLYDNEYFGLQVENPSNKVKITMPTQLQHAIDNEQDDDTISYFTGDNTPVDIKTIRQLYQSALAAKSKVLFEGAKAEMYEFEELNTDLTYLIQQGKITPRLARFQEKAIENLQSSGADMQLLEFFELDEEGKPLYNLNNDLILEKYTQLYLSHFSKGSFSMKSPGHSIALMSGLGVKLVKQVVDSKPDGSIQWRVIRTDSQEYKELLTQNITYKIPTWEPRTDLTKDMRYIDANLNYGDYFIDSAAYNVPEYDPTDRTIIIGYYSEGIMPYQTADQSIYSSSELIPKEIQYMFGNRIPLQDKHSMLAIKWVDTLPLVYGSTGVYPDELVELSGADFDIDKLFITIADTYIKNGRFYQYGNKETKEEQFSEYLQWQLKNNKFLKSFITEFKNQDERYGLLENQLWSIRTKLKGVKRAVNEYNAKTDLYNFIEKTLSIRYDEDGNRIKTYEYGNPILDVNQNRLENKLTVLHAELNGFSTVLTDNDYYTNLLELIQSTLNEYEYSYLFQAIEKYAPMMPTSVENFNPLYNTGAANNTILNTMLPLLTNDYVRNGIADQPATQDYLAEQATNPAFIREDGSKVFGGTEKLPIDSFLAHITVKRKNNIGKDNIGIDVGGNVQNTILKKGNIRIQPENGFILYRSVSKEEEARINFNDFSVRKEYSLETGEENSFGKRIMDVISTKISASTDEAKDGNNALFNLGAEQSKVLSIMSGLGVPLPVIIAFVNQPILKVASKKFNKKGLATREEAKFKTEEEVFDAFLEKLEKNEEEQRVAELELIEEYGSLDRMFTFENLTEILVKDWNTKSYNSFTPKEKVLFSFIQEKVVEEYKKMLELADQRAMIGDILKLNKGLDSFDTISKALNSAKKLGLVNGILPESALFDVRYIFTGDEEYPRESNYVHQTSITYLNQIKQVVSLAKLNFINQTAFFTGITDSIVTGLNLNRDQQKQLNKDLHSFITLSVYKNLIDNSETFTNNLLIGPRDENIIGIYRELKQLRPANPLVNYVITNTKRVFDGTKTTEFNTLETNSFSRLSDAQLGNLINGYIELWSDEETKKYAEALFDYLLVKDGMQFKNRSISKLFPAAAFSSLSAVTDVAHTVLLADTPSGFSRVLTELNTKYNLFTQKEIDNFKTSQTDEQFEMAKDTIFTKLFGYTQNEFYNQFLDLIIRQPTYSKKAQSIYLGTNSKALSMTKNTLELDINKLVSDEEKKEFIFTIGLDYEKDKKTGKLVDVFYPKYVKTKTAYYRATTIDTVSDPTGIPLESGKTTFLGKKAIYTKIEVNMIENWNQMADLIDYNVEVIEPVKENTATIRIHGINISTKSDDALGRALTNPTTGSKRDGKDYYDVETIYKQNASKQKAPELNAEDALRYDMNLMFRLQVEKFRQNPELVDEITKRGGIEFLKASSHIIGIKNSRWEGTGETSNFIRVLMKAYEKSLADRTEMNKFIDISSSTKKSPYFEKDKEKFKNATKLIARGSTESSSEAYRIAVGNKANTSNYTINDVVAISAEGNRTNRISPDLTEINKAINANVKGFVTDNAIDRQRSYNVGEREIADYLVSQGYQEIRDTGRWIKSIKPIELQVTDDFGSFMNDADEEYIYEYKSASVKSLETKVNEFLTGLNIDSQSFDTLKEVTGYNAVSAVDLLNKVALFRNDAPTLSYAKEAAYVAYSLLGRKNKIVTDLKYSIENIDNYATIAEKYKTQNSLLPNHKIKELIIVDFIADAIITNFNIPKNSYINRQSDFWSIKGNSSIEKRFRYLLQKLKFFFNDLFSINKLSNENLNKLADDIANDILTKNYTKFQKELKPDQQLTNYQETIANDPTARTIVENFQRMGLLLTGSLAIRKQGTLYRSKEETLHDLDFTVEKRLMGEELQRDFKEFEESFRAASAEADRNKMLVNFKDYLNNRSTKYKWFKEVKEMYPSFQLTNYFTGLKSGDITLTGLIDNNYSIDFFVLAEKDTNLESNEKGFQQWKSIFAAKLRMGRAKDMVDFINFKPFDGIPDKLAQTSGFRHFTFNQSPFKNINNNQDNTTRCD